ncbi:MAG: hypothetical protein HY657_13915 [Acidobacteria bacterium]|nr:hypothetical protein [Acidobacteriota bacterium]
MARRTRMISRVFLLSPANCSGNRGRMIVSPRAEFPLARQLRTRDGALLGDVFSFVSGLYFRGKLAYARRFARPPDPGDPIAAGGVLVITPNAGLRAADTPLTLASFRAFAQVDIHLRNPAYRKRLECVADEHAEHDWDEHRLCPVQHGHYGRARDHSERHGPEVDGHRRRSALGGHDSLLWGGAQARGSATDDHDVEHPAAGCKGSATRGSAAPRRVL